MDKIQLLTKAWDLINEAGGKAPRDRHEFAHLLKLLEFEIAAEFNLLQGTTKNG